MTKVTKQQLIDSLKGLKGSRLVTIVTQTQPTLVANHPLTGEANPYKGKVFKVATTNGVINWSYERSVNRQRAREGSEPDFEAYPRKWGERLAGTPLVEHKGKTYVELKVEKSVDYDYFDLDGKPVDADLIKPYLRPPGKSRQEVAKEVICRDYAVDSILELRVDGQQYQIQ